MLLNTALSKLQFMNVESEIVASLKSQFKNWQPFAQIEHISILFKLHCAKITSENFVLKNAALKKQTFFNSPDSAAELLK